MGFHVFSIEFIDHDLWSRLRQQKRGRLASKLRPWVAAVRFDKSGRVAHREFISGTLDHSEASGTGGEGVLLSFGLQEHVVYEVRDRSRAPGDRFFLIHDGERFLELTKGQAIDRAGCQPGVAPSLFQGVDPTANRKYLGVSVLDATKQRIAWTFDSFERVYLSFSAGKDSSVMLHLAAQEARRRRRKFGLLLIDLEAQYKFTIDHALECFREYADCIDPYWVALPLVLRNAVSQYQPRWICWDPEAREAWVRQPPDFAVCNGDAFPFYRHAMEFEEFVDEFGHWYGAGKLTACLVGIRTQESLNRFRSLMMGKITFQGRRWTTWKTESLFNVYPIYDWKTEDIWRYNAKTGKSYNRVYDAMHKAGLSIHQARICQPYGDDQRKGLWLYSVIEPHTWAKVVSRVGGANTGALYAHKSGSMMGRIKVNLPPGHTWESFTKLLLASTPPALRTHYENKIAVFLKWYQDRGVYPIPDDTDPELAKRFPKKGGPSWRRVCQVLLKHDYWCKGLSFSQTTSRAYENYLKMMRKRRERWNVDELLRNGDTGAP